MAITPNWTTPIYDRTQTDVDNALEYLATAKTSVVSQKGCFNYTDWNRIVANCLYVVSMASDWSYTNLPTFSTTEYDYTSILRQTNVSALLNNIQSLATTITKSISLPVSLSSFDDVNMIEEAINDIHTGLGDVSKNISGTFTIPAGSTASQTTSTTILSNYDNKTIKDITITSSSSTHTTNHSVSQSYNSTTGIFSITLSVSKSELVDRTINYTITYKINNSRNS